jgi:hypothetical protein
MINISELRLGNYILHKVNNKVSVVKCAFQHFELVNKEGTRDLYPVVLKSEILGRCGFTENESYPLRPGAQEFVLLLAVPGSDKNEIKAYVKSNKECFGRATVNGLTVSQNFFHLHQLQNLYFILTGKEMALPYPI